MAEHGITVRDVARLEVARVGRVEETDDRVMPFRLLDDQGVEIAAVTEFLHHMLADDASAVSLRSYAYELLSWHRFLRAVEVPWHLAGRTEARDFALWLKTSKKPLRQRRPDAPAPGSVNPITGKATSGANYAARTRRHARAVIRSFYEYHREMHGRPLVNPFPKARGVDEHLNAHHNPMRPFRRPSRRAVYQPKEPKPAPRSIPDQAFSELFAALDCNRDRALVAFYMSTGARASELLGVCQGLVVPEEQVISVVRKGSRALQRLPASTDAFVWLRLYQQETRDLVPKGPKEATVVDFAPSVPAADIRRHPDGLQQGQHRAGRELDTARSAAFRREEDGPRPGPDPGRRPVGPRARPHHHHRDLHRADPR